ncbi:hypothetical protein CBR_g40465 [Chara braunii]|uniref:Annexin n=1 Tax=Chara braunii TaxID=69332 RepID=A0A388LTV0_CHABU|nr:hypothetical protein CBR_g40465 [Chara braunii]|eukprot:GBG85737.1 hypothetical protein CBR_g40465 [Chara braunii]
MTADGARCVPVLRREELSRVTGGMDFFADLDLEEEQQEVEEVVTALVEKKVVSKLSQVSAIKALPFAERVRHSRQAELPRQARLVCFSFKKPNQGDNNNTAAVVDGSTTVLDWRTPLCCCSCVGVSCVLDRRTMLGTGRSFDAEDDCSVFNHAIKALAEGREQSVREEHEKRLLEILMQRTRKQREQLVPKYSEMFGGDLIAELKAVAPASLHEGIDIFLLPSARRDATLLHNAISGLGTDDRCLIDILCMRSSAEITDICTEYKQCFHQELEDDLRGDCSSSFYDLLEKLLQARRPGEEDCVVDIYKAKASSMELYAGGVWRTGTNERKFIDVFTSEGWPQLKEIFQVYEETYGHSIEEAIEGETSGSFRRGLLAITQCARSKDEYFANRLRKSLLKSMSWSLRDPKFLRTFFRCVDDGNWGPVKTAYEAKYGEFILSFDALNASLSKVGPLSSVLFKAFGVDQTAETPHTTSNPQPDPSS